jgi:hypothetical protein
VYCVPRAYLARGDPPNLGKSLDAILCFFVRCNVADPTDQKRNNTTPGQKELPTGAPNCLANKVFNARVEFFFFFFFFRLFLRLRRRRRRRWHVVNCLFCRHVVLDSRRKNQVFLLTGVLDSITRETGLVVVHVVVFVLCYQTIELLPPPSRRPLPLLVSGGVDHESRRQSGEIRRQSTARSCALSRLGSRFEHNNALLLLFVLSLVCKRFCLWLFIIAIFIFILKNVVVCKNQSLTHVVVGSDPVRTKKRIVGSFETKMVR